MASFTLVLHDGSNLGARIPFHVDDATSVRSEWPSTETVQRLPRGATYIASYGLGIAKVTWDVFFGNRIRLVGTEFLDGNAHFQKFKRDIWDKYQALRGSKKALVRRLTRLEYHDWDLDQHYWCTASTWEENRDHDNPGHPEGTIVFSLYAPIEGKLTVAREDGPGTAFRVQNSLEAFLEQLNTASQIAKGMPQGLLDKIKDTILKPARQILGALKNFTEAITSFVEFPAKLVIDIVNGIDEISSSLLSIATFPLATVVNTMHNARRALVRLLNIPGVWKESFEGSIENIKSAAKEFEQSVDSTLELNRKRFGLGQETSVQLQALRASKSARSVRVRAGDTLASIAQRELGNADRAIEIAILNDLDDGSELSVGDILVPDEGEIVTGSSDLASSGLSPEERFYGRDFAARLVKHNKLQLVWTDGNDLLTQAGVENVKNALMVRQTVRAGTLLDEPEYGIALPDDAQDENSARLLKWSLERVAKQDPRVDKATSSIAVQGNQWEAVTNVELAGIAGQQVSVQVSRGG